MLTAISRYGPRVIPNTLEVIDELESLGELVDGPHRGFLEAQFSARLGGRRAVTTSYGRMAFFYILQAYGFPAGGEVIFPALTFWVMPEMARIAGLTPVFADVDPVTFNVTADAIKRVLTSRTVALVPTHLWGLPCDMDEIVDLARKHRLVVIEDCAHALGATYRERSVGTLGDAAIFSFQTFKPLNAYGGGLAVAADLAVGARVAELASNEPLPSLQRVRQRLWHGRVLRLATRPDVFKWTLFPLLYVGTRLGWSIDMYFWEQIRTLDPMPADYRERFSNIQAAIALEGLSHLNEWTSARQKLAGHMTRLLSKIPGVRPPSTPADRTHVYYQYCAYVPSRDAIVDACLRRGIDIETLHVDICTELPIFGPTHTPTPGAQATQQTIQIPVYESLSISELERVAAVVGDAVIALAAESPRTVPQSP